MTQVSLCIKRELLSIMINQITALESCWHTSPPWGETMPPLAVQIQEKVFLSNSDLSGYCYGVHWENQEWIYAMVMLEIASPQDAEAVLRAISDNNDGTQTARDDRAQRILSESLTNRLGSHVRYD